jgi:hypothetical protein
MTAAELELLDQPEAECVIRWRLRSLGEAGYGFDDALALAVQPEVDLHLAADLLRRGCPPETALRILR